jgi:maleate isomerase
MAPNGVGIHAARVPFGAMGAGGTMDPTIPLAPVAAFAEPPHIDDATALLAAAPLRAIGIGFTSTAYVLGAHGETAMVTRLEQRSCGIPVVSTCAAAVLALRSVRAQRLALVNPPWFDALGAKFLTSQGFDVVSHAPCGLPSNQRSINPPGLYDWVRDQTPDRADAMRSSSVGTAAARWVSSTRWSRICDVRCPPRIKSCYGVAFTWLRCT